MSETVQVTGESPLIDVKQNASFANIQQDVIDRIPKGRNFTDVVSLAPGANKDRACLRVSSTSKAALRVCSAGALFLLLAVAIGLVTLTRARNDLFASERALWVQNVEACPSSARARTNLAAGLIAEGRYADAEPHLRAALARRPGEVEARASLGVALVAQGCFDEGIPWLGEAVAARPDDPVARRNLAEAYASQGRDAEAVPHFLAALEHEGDDVSLLNGTAWLLATSPEARRRPPRSIAPPAWPRPPAGPTSCPNSTRAWPSTVPANPSGASPY